MVARNVSVQQSQGIVRRRNAWILAFLFPPAFVPAWHAAAPALIPEALATATGCLTVAALAVSAYSDTRWRLIPNWVTYSAVLWALLINVFASVADTRTTNLSVGNSNPGYLGAIGIGPCLLGLSVCFLAMLLIYSVTKGGAGDVKLAAALGALLGVERGLMTICYAYVLAGAFAMCLLIWRLGPLVVCQSFGRFLGGGFTPRTPGRPTTDAERLLGASLPLGAFFAIATPLAILGVPDPVVFF